MVRLDRNRRQHGKFKFDRKSYSPLSILKISFSIIVGIAMVNIVILQRALSTTSADHDPYGESKRDMNVRQQQQQQQQSAIGKRNDYITVQNNNENTELLQKKQINTGDENQLNDDDNENAKADNSNDNNNSTIKRQNVGDYNADEKDVEVPVLTAYAEPPFDYMAKPTLPSRLHLTPESLTRVEYPNVNSCSNLSGQFPVNDEDSPPVELDPFLPWIHDIFPNAEGDKINFIAQHRRRCHVGKPEWLEKFAPQGSLFQHVPIKRTGNTNADGTTQYQLTSHKEADEDGVMSRFICRFHSTTSNELYETLSIFPLDYDYATWRKGYPATFTEAGKDVHMVWSSQLVFECPVPKALQAVIKSGDSVVDDYATVFLDLVPARTATRYNAPAEFLAPKFNDDFKSPKIDTKDFWGETYVLPPIESSGRIANIPICLPPGRVAEGDRNIDATGRVRNEDPVEDSNLAEVGTEVTVGANEKPHELVACTWASTNFLTRQNAANVKDGDRRLKEWIQHNLNAGFDHVYVYDNSGAFSTEKSLKHVTDLFPPDKVTRINWPSKICNNNLARHSDKGERSSQYAADSSCRVRYGPQTKWLTFIDTDEYLVPVGNYTSLKTLVRDIEEKEDKKIINFYSARAKPHFKHIEIMDDGAPMPKPDVPFLEAYNCEREPPPKKFWMPAEKQIYRPDYVLLHFIHYPTVSTQSQMSRSETNEAGLQWKQRHNEDRMGNARFINELTEATMIHTKAVTTAEIGKEWKDRCQKLNCHFGFAFPEGEGLDKSKKIEKNSDGNVMNCYPNPIVTDRWVPKLREELSKLESREVNE